MDTVLGCLVTDSVGPGEYTEKFLKSAREVFSFDGAAALRSPYLALLAALKKFSLPAGAKVGISPLAPFYHLIVLGELGFEPVFMDHDPQTCLPDLDSIAAKGCSAIVLFEPFGMLPKKEEVERLGISVVEDMSQSLGATRGEARAGSIGNFSIYGLEQGSPVTAGGGALLFASSRRDSAILKNAAETLPREIVLTDYNAALGLAQLRDLPNTLLKRKELEAAFQMELAKTRHRTFRQEDEGEGGRYAFPVVLASGMKDAIIHAKKNGVEAAPAFEQSILAGEGFPENECPGARSLALRCVLFPLHEKIGSKDAHTIQKMLATLP